MLFITEKNATIVFWLYYSFLNQFYQFVCNSIKKFVFSIFAENLVDSNGHSTSSGFPSILGVPELKSWKISCFHARSSQSGTIQDADHAVCWRTKRQTGSRSAWNVPTHEKLMEISPFFKFIALYLTFFFVMFLMITIFK